MSIPVRERFLIALAKFFGENPTEVQPLAKLLLCEDWQLDEALRTIIGDDDYLKLNKARFDQLMLHCGRRLPTLGFYEYFFAAVRTISDFERAVERFRICAALLFGNFKYGYRTLATSDEKEFRNWIRRVEPADKAEFTDREEFTEIEKIPEDDLYLLGYVSSAELNDLDLCLEAIRRLKSTGDSIDQVLGKLGVEKQRKISEILTKHSLSFPAAGSAGLTPEALQGLEVRLVQIIEPLRARTKSAQEIGQKNTDRYLTLSYLDVYVATSMREKQDYTDQHHFIRQVFEHSDVKPLRLSYFDPTLSYVDDRITKGLIECLMIRRARITLYNAGYEDTLGKDSELASSLAQGKPVIVYVPVGQDAESKEKLKRREKLFKEDHPLGLQIDIRTGVAHGVIVVRTPNDCARMLSKTLLRTLELEFVHQQNIHMLREKETKSILRVVSDDPHLTHIFWTYFHGPVEQ